MNNKIKHNMIIRIILLFVRSILILVLSLIGLYYQYRNYHNTCIKFCHSILQINNNIKVDIQDKLMLLTMHSREGINDILLKVITSNVYISKYYINNNYLYLEILPEGYEFNTVIKIDTNKINNNKLNTNNNNLLTNNNIKYNNNNNNTTDNKNNKNNLSRKKFKYNKLSILIGNKK